MGYGLITSGFLLAAVLLLCGRGRGLERMAPILRIGLLDEKLDDGKLRHYASPI